MCAVVSGTNDHVAYASVDINKSTCRRYRGNVTYNDIMTQVTQLFTTV